MSNLSSFRFLKPTRNIKKMILGNNVVPVWQHIRFAGGHADDADAEPLFSYRNIQLKIPKQDYNRAKAFSAFFWWWVLWHLFTDGEELIGEFAPDPSKFTDEELGIPPE